MIIFDLSQKKASRKARFFFCYHLKCLFFQQKFD